MNNTNICIQLHKMMDIYHVSFAKYIHYGSKERNIYLGVQLPSLFEKYDCTLESLNKTVLLVQYWIIRLVIELKTVSSILSLRSPLISFLDNHSSDHPELKVRSRLHSVKKGWCKCITWNAIFVKSCIISCYSSLLRSVVSFQAAG